MIYNWKSTFAPLFRKRGKFLPSKTTKIFLKLHNIKYFNSRFKRSCVKLSPLYFKHKRNLKIYINSVWEWSGKSIKNCLWFYKAHLFDNSSSLIIFLKEQVYVLKYLEGKTFLLLKTIYVIYACEVLKWWVGPTISYYYTSNHIS